MTIGPRLCFSADRSHSGGSTKGERLSAKMRSLPVPSEPYETSAPKELGEKALTFSHPDDPSAVSVTSAPSAVPSAVPHLQMPSTWTRWGLRWSGPRREPRSGWRTTTLRMRCWETTCCPSRRRRCPTSTSTQAPASVWVFFKSNFRITWPFFCALNLKISLYIPCIYCL